MTYDRSPWSLHVKMGACSSLFQPLKSSSDSLTWVTVVIDYTYLDFPHLLSFDMWTIYCGKQNMYFSILMVQVGSIQKIKDKTFIHVIQIMKKVYQINES